MIGLSQAVTKRTALKSKLSVHGTVVPHPPSPSLCAVHVKSDGQQVPVVGPSSAARLFRGPAHHDRAVPCCHDGASVVGAPSSALQDAKREGKKGKIPRNQQVRQNKSTERNGSRISARSRCDRQRILHNKIMQGRLHATLFLDLTRKDRQNPILSVSPSFPSTSSIGIPHVESISSKNPSLSFVLQTCHM